MPNTTTHYAVPFVTPLHSVSFLRFFFVAKRVLFVIDFHIRTQGLFLCSNQSFLTCSIQQVVTQTHSCACAVPQCTATFQLILSLCVLSLSLSFYKLCLFVAECRPCLKEEMTHAFCTSDLGEFIFISSYQTKQLINYFISF